MDTQQVERELAAMLRRRAEHTMNRTNTQEAHRTFQSVVAGQPQKGRRRWVVAGVAAAVVAVAVGVALWPSGQDLGGSSVPAVEAPDSTSVANLAAAEAVAAAWIAHDTELLAPYLEPGLSPPESDWSTEFMRDAAWGVEYLMEPCSEKYSTSDDTRIECPYRMHLLGSREVGVGPFSGNELTVVLTDGKVISAATRNSWQWNGIEEHVDSVAAWVEENHPKDAKFLLLDEQRVAPADWPRWSRLWTQYLAEYVAATNETG